MDEEMAVNSIVCCVRAIKESMKDMVYRDLFTRDLNEPSEDTQGKYSAYREIFRVFQSHFEQFGLERFELDFDLDFLKSPSVT
ncbi:hypothetical protein FACS18948_2130 [Clostridia bacterium]|nr:hypothetical protein FACS18948_2130 [Clostridia bacterium]